MKHSFRIFSFFVLLILASSSAFATIVVNHPTHTSNIVTGNSNDDAACGRYNSGVSNLNVTTITFWASTRTGTPTSTAALYSDNGANKPDKLIFTDFSTVAVPTNGFFNITPNSQLILNASTLYWFCHVGVTWSASNYYMLQGQNTGVEANVSYRSNGGAWSNLNWNNAWVLYAKDSVYTGTFNKVHVINLYNDTDIEGINVSFGNGGWNLTDSNGVATIFNGSGTLSFTILNSTEYYNNGTGFVDGNETAEAGVYKNKFNVTTVTQKYTGNVVNAPYNCTVGTKTYDSCDDMYLENGANSLTWNKNNYISLSTSITGTFVSNGTANISDVFNNQYHFNASDAWNLAKLYNFTITAYNGSIGTLQNSTTTGDIVFDLLQGYNYLFSFVSDEGTYEELNVTLAANATQQYYEFETLPTPSIDITIYDATDGSLITENMTIIMSNNVTGDVFYTVTGGYFITNITPGDYTIKIQNINYTQSVYIVTASASTVYFLDAYLQRNITDEVTFQFVDSITSTTTLTGAFITQQTLVNGSYVSLSIQPTDITGRVLFYYEPGVAYRFIAVLSGYETKTFTLDPILFTSYTVKMTKTSIIDFSQDFQEVYINYNPKMFYDGQQNQINITILSPLGYLTGYSYTLDYPGGTDTDSGSNVNGETFTVDFNIAGANIYDTVNITIEYDGSVGTTKTFLYKANIVVSPGNQTFIANQGNTYGLGLVDRALIGILILIIVAGLTAAFAGPIWGLSVALFIMGVWLKIGFWEWWLAGISFLVGVALLIKRSD